MRIVMPCIALVVILVMLTAVAIQGQDTVSEPTNKKASPVQQTVQFSQPEPYTYLEPGFPVKAWFAVGGWSYAVVYLTVGNIDADPRMEILSSGWTNGPLYAWHHDGTDVTGWPVQMDGIAYPALGPLTNVTGPLDVFTANYHPKPSPNDMAAYSGDSQLLPGHWPLTSANKIIAAPALEDVTGDGIFEIFVGETDGKLHAYDAAGNPLPGWPVSDSNVPQLRWDRPSFADIDNNGELEIVLTAVDWYSSVDHLMAFRPDGSQLPWSPVTYEAKEPSYVTIGDVDGDLDLELIVAGLVSGVEHVIVFSNTGQIERQMPLVSQITYTCGEPVLADLDGDSFPEIIVQSDDGIDVFKGDTGQAYPGWPVSFPSGSEQTWSHPVVGDVDGDKKPEIVATILYFTGIQQGQLRIYETNGTLNKNMGAIDMPLNASGVPAIADIDLDGRNEVLVLSTYAPNTGYFDSVWAFDLKGPKAHGPILWGQFGGSAAHQGRYPVPEL